MSRIMADLASQPRNCANTGGITFILHSIIGRLISASRDGANPVVG